MNPFFYESLPMRVTFGVGSQVKVKEEVQHVGARSALVLCTEAQRGSAEHVATLLGSRAAGIYDKAQMHVPIETAEEARALADSLGADCCVAVGGGSTIGLGKAIALTSGLPIIAIPTTFAGSEMTPIYGITEARLKRTGRDISVLPKSVIYDPDLSITLPPRIAATSGLNAIAHAVEALYSADANPITSLMAEESIRTLARSLPRLMAAPTDRAAASDALYGAWLAGACLGAVGMAIHHKLCHTLGGTFNLPHAEMHTIVLPHSVAYNREAAPEAMARISRALGGVEAASGLYDLAASLGVPMSLSDIGMPADGLELAAQLATQNPYYNPRPIDREGILELLTHAYHGRRPVHS
ncbi:maleylacetate reductase [Pollutimonas subterranea]|uniref:maleylacetate reductase n=1 Tax=Pollutimonas subterranea TaxID=2045210 RepID=A0A2N4TYX8_9BURK|nr:maleylacetate reductase [Pollutimonas subterranea]PLC47975.1 maleylacetate reductase [Pollutimonas subterranea]